MEKIQKNWKQWKQKQKQYPNINLWWVRHCKKRLRQMFQCEDPERKRDHGTMQNFYYDCMYEILRTADTRDETIPALNHIKATTVKVHNQRLKTTMFDNAAADNLLGEQPTLYQLE